MRADELEALVRAGRKEVLYEPAAAHAVSLGRVGVERLLPHRDPFLLVDSIDAVDLIGPCIAGRRQISAEDPVFLGHFPGDPVYPGVLQVEAMAQLGLCLFGLLKTDTRGVRALKIHHAAFHAPVRPGDALTITAKVLDSTSLTGVAAGQLTRGATICSFAITEFYFARP